MHLLRLSIQQSYGQIGVQTNLVRLDLESPRGELSIKQEPASMDFHSEPGVLEIDSTDAWAALGKGGHIAWMNSIYSQVESISLQAIAKIVDDGNQMADLTNRQNAFADIAASDFGNIPQIQYVGEASFLNVKMNYQMQPAVTAIEPNHPTIEYTPSRVQAQYNRGNVDVYMKQMNSIDIQVSEYDWYK